ncbi:MAG: hypothetical protein ACYSUT_11685, partial [Planctomycetota bacterium]
KRNWKLIESCLSPRNKHKLLSQIRRLQIDAPVKPKSKRSKTESRAPKKSKPKKRKRQQR